MKKTKIIFNIILGIIFACAFLLPDYISKFFTNKNHVIFYPEFSYMILGFSFFLSFLGIWWVRSILVIFGILEISQFANLFYFGDFINFENIGFIFSEASEITEFIFSAPPVLYLVPLIITIPYGLSYFIFVKLKGFRVTSKIGMIPVIIFLLAGPYKVMVSDNLSIFYPTTTIPSLRNTIYAYSAYLLKALPKEIKGKNKKKSNHIPYDIKKISTVGEENIILVIGESVSYLHMSLFGYERKTTPNLDKMHDLIFKKGIASGTTTKVSLPYLMNIIGEPGNHSQIQSYNSNLFRLAKESGFKTFYISAQDGNLTRNIGTSFVDVLVVQNNFPELFDAKCDDMILDVLRKQQYGKKNFIVLHQRNIHAPYKERYKHRKEFENFPVKGSVTEQTINSYDNAMLYNDAFLKEVKDYFFNLSKNPTYIFITSDHGEMLGEEGKFGHIALEPGVGKVPFILIARDYNQRLFSEIKAKDYISHYGLGKIIAELLGYRIDNKNHKANTHYMTGVNDNSLEIREFNGELEYVPHSTKQ